MSAFREELRMWLAENMTDDLVGLGAGLFDASNVDRLRLWNEKLASAGWAAPSWPAEHGGRGADIDDQIAYLEEMAAAGAPGPLNVIGVSNIAPAIMFFGTTDQKERFIGPMLRGEEIWSQGMSEPDAGSDLASLRTAAVLDGDHFVVNGQKTWNSLGHLADWCQLYVRTDPTAPKHRGISCLLVDLHSPGIEARPLRSITGELAFSDLFFADARIPTDALLGELNQGWTVAMTTLGFERAGVARLHLSLSGKLRDLMAEPGVQGAMTDRRMRARVARIHSDVACMRWFTERSLARPDLFGGAGGSLAKLSWSRCDQQLAELAVDLLGMDGLSGRWAHNLTAARQTSIVGGTTEINRTIVGEQALGLPR